jgi:hypothetical protein
LARKKLFTKNNRWLWITLYALWVVFILISATAFYAEQSINTRANGSYSYQLKFDQDGEIEHYIVELVDTSKPGRIWLTYYKTSNHRLEVTTENIKKLTIDCRSIAEEKSREIVGIDYEDNENFYKEYFINEDQFSVSVDSDHAIDLIFLDVPYPSKVFVDGMELEEGNDFTYFEGVISTGEHKAGHTDVEIYFRDTGDNLNAYFTTDNRDSYHLPKTTIIFDASSSSPEDEIVDYLWDFGDGDYDSGQIVQHSYNVEDDYKAILVVRNEDGEIASYSKKIYVHDEDEDSLPDNWEAKYNIQDPNGDNDNDGLSNRNEYLKNTDPMNGDSDNDGVKDGKEVEMGTDPTNPYETPSQEEDDKEDAGIMGMGKVGGIDLFIILVLIIIIIIILIAVMATGKRGREEEEEVEEEVEEEEEEEEEEEDVYECPECGATIYEDQPECSECGATLEWEEEEEEDIEEAAVAEEEDEAEETAGAEEYECPTCGAAVKEEDTVCPNCGEEFE